MNTLMSFCACTLEWPVSLKFLSVVVGYGLQVDNVSSLLPQMIKRVLLQGLTIISSPFRQLLQSPYRFHRPADECGLLPIKSLARNIQLVRLLSPLRCFPKRRRNYEGYANCDKSDWLGKNRLKPHHGEGFLE